MRAAVSVEIPIPSPTNKMTFLALVACVACACAVFVVSLVCAALYQLLSFWLCGSTSAWLTALNVNVSAIAAATFLIFIRNSHCLVVIF